MHLAVAHSPMAIGSSFTGRDWVLLFTVHTSIMCTYIAPIKVSQYSSVAILYYCWDSLEKNVCKLYFIKEECSLLQLIAISIHFKTQ